MLKAIVFLLCSIFVGKGFEIKLGGNQRSTEIMRSSEIHDLQFSNRTGSGCSSSELNFFIDTLNTGARSIYDVLGLLKYTEPRMKSAFGQGKKVYSVISQTDYNAIDGWSIYSIGN